MNYWELLGISQTDDISAIKKAYAQKSKLYHPETHPEEFKQLHTAYKNILSTLKKRTRPLIEPAQPEPVSLPKATVSRNVVIPTPPKPDIPNTTRTVSSVISTETAQNETIETVIDEEKILQNALFIDQINEFAQIQNQTLYHDPMIQKLENILKDESIMYYHETWQEYFVSPAFLERQYRPDFITSMANVLKEQLNESAKEKNRLAGRFPTHLFLYIVIAYGRIFGYYTTEKLREKLYKKDLLKDLLHVINLHEDKGIDYLRLEREDDLLGDRFAFYAYRNILEILENENPDKAKLRLWLVDAFDRTNITHVTELLHHTPIEGCGKWVGKLYLETNRIINSPIIYELIAYLLGSNHPHSQILEDMVENVYNRYRLTKDHRDEWDVLMLIIKENRAKRSSL